MSRFELDTSSKRAYLKDLLKLVITHVFGASEKDVSTYAFSDQSMKIVTSKFTLEAIGVGQHQATSEVFLLTLLGPDGPKKSLVIKIITAGSVTRGSSDTPEQVLIREVSNLIKTSEMLEGKPYIQVPKVVDVARVSHSDNLDSYMFAAEVAPGQDLFTWMGEDLVGKTPEGLAQGLVKLRERLAVVGRALALFHTSKAPALSGKAELERDITILQRILKTLKEDSVFSKDPHTNLQTAQKIETALDQIYQRLLQRGDVALVQTHRDFHLGNVFVDGEVVTPIDLESRRFGVSGEDYGKFLYFTRRIIQYYLHDYDPATIKQAIQAERAAFLTAYKETAAQGDLKIPAEEVDLLSRFYEAQEAIHRFYSAHGGGNIEDSRQILQTLKNILQLSDGETALLDVPEAAVATVP